MKAAIRFRSVLLFGFLFVFQAAFRFALADAASQLWSRYVIGPILALAMVVWIAALAELPGGAVTRLRIWFLLSWSLSLGLGIPALFDNPGVARLTMGNDSAIQNSLIWAPQGVGEYTIYSAFAICVGPIFAVTQLMTGVKRWIGYTALMLGAASVILSTFSMAATLLVAGLLAVLAVGVITTDRGTRKVRLAFIGGLVALMPSLYILSNANEQTDFVIQKVSNLVTGISNRGLAQGDETERGSWFVEEMGTFLENPLLGHSFDNSLSIEHGHSSLSNGLVLFGFLGSMLWFATLWQAFRTIRSGLTQAIDRHALQISAALFIAAGILNPSWHASGILIPLFALIIPEGYKGDTDGKYVQRLVQ